MKSVDLPLSPPIIAVFFLFAFSLLKWVWCDALGCQLRLPGAKSRDDRQFIKAKSSTETPFGQAAAITVEKESTFSADWWCDDIVFRLEQRAIFSKSWMYATHRSQFSKPGDYITLNVAGFSFFLILGKDQVLRAFHNVCRHRAYEVTRKERGSSTVLGCRYHGWSYDTKGQLTKAPEFDTVPDFDKKMNGLWEIHVRVNAQGLVFVNLDADETISDLAQGNLDTNNRHFIMSQSNRMAEWRYDGDFNWKIAYSMGSTNINMTHLFQDIPDKSHWITRLSDRIFMQKRELSQQVDWFTMVSRHPTQPICIVVKIVPHSATKTTIEYELYARAAQDSSNLEELVKKLKETTFAEIERLQLLQNETVQGRLVLDHVQMGQQSSINALLVVHRNLERLKGLEIYPAAQQINLSDKGQEDVDLCKTLEKAVGNASPCAGQSGRSSPSGSLDW